MRYLFAYIFAAIALYAVGSTDDGALRGLMHRISPGLEDRVTVVLAPDSICDQYTLMPMADGSPGIVATSRVAAARGLHSYLTRYCGVGLSWADGLDSISLPKGSLPLPDSITVTCNAVWRYCLNYCTVSYSMAFWGERQWQRELDRMALRGINMVLASCGMDAVWVSALQRLGYRAERAMAFPASSAYSAWWLMGNLEGVGPRPNQQSLDKSARLLRYVTQSMRQMDMKVVLPGFSGIMPSDASEALGVATVPTGKWCGYVRPAVIKPDVQLYDRVAKAYYDALHEVSGGVAPFYAIDPMHEGGDASNISLRSLGECIMSVMPGHGSSRILLQGWQENPRRELLDALGPDAVILDLHAETVPQWLEAMDVNNPRIWCMLLNFGGNTGLHGKFNHVPVAYSVAKDKHPAICGVGLTMEGIDNNEMLYDLVADMCWSDFPNSLAEWLERYIIARYGGETVCREVVEAWKLLASTVLNAPASNRQQGTTESPFCALPSDTPGNVSAWANAEPYYDGGDVVRAARMLSAGASSLGANRHYAHDFVDVTRQAVTELARGKWHKLHDASLMCDSAAYRRHAQRFLDLMLMQDSMLSVVPGMRLSDWTCASRCYAENWHQDADEVERSARTLITTWGNRNAAECGRLHNYAHREWSGLLRDVYYRRWQRWFGLRLASWSDTPERPDWYAMDSVWCNDTSIHYKVADASPQRMTSEAMHALQMLSNFDQ